MISDDSTHPAASFDEQLVAYLDGELDAENRRRVEEILTSDVQVRRRLQQMERTWNLLDHLDAVPPGSQFTQTTLEMVAVEANQDVQQNLAEVPRRRRRWRLLAGLTLVVALAAGFFTVVRLAPDPNRQLLEDLPVLENLDEYRQVDDVEFLRLLRDAGLFVGHGEMPEGAAPPPAESLVKRQERIEEMSPGEKSQLSRLERRFLALDEEQQEQLRQLHKAIEAASDGGQLRQVMHRYYEWLKTLPLCTRTELGGLEPAERLDAVKKRLKDEHGQRLGEADSEAFWKWLTQFVTAHEKQLLDRLSDSRRREMGQWTPQARQLVLLTLLDAGRRPGPGSGKPPPLMTEADLANLRGLLGPETRLYLESLPTKAKQWQQVILWMRHALRQQHARSSFSIVDDERLADFFEKLSDDERDHLLNLPGDEMQRELKQLYLTRTKLPDAAPRRSRPPAAERPAKKKADRPSARSGD
jgi:hypothetical protein